MAAEQLTVVSLSDSFAGFWDEVAEHLGLTLRRTSEPEPPSARTVAVVISCGGREEGAIDALHAAARVGIAGPFVVGARADHRLAVELMRRGAGGYFALPGDRAWLIDDLRAAIESARAGLASDAGGVERRERYDFSAIIGEHPDVRKALELAARVIPAERTTVLILGETGTGKELMARAIHENGPRRARPFVGINCAAIPANLVESELFGHERGAFTGASAAKPGLFEVADGGTVFLDEVATLPIELQAKLLRFLETREVRRVGAIKGVEVDVRILAAANVDLEDLVRRGEFREDLYFRLAVVPIRLPPLRARGEDVMLLARSFLADLAAGYGLEPPRMSPAATDAIRRHAWPGNVRELRNAMERALLLSDDAIEPDHLGLLDRAIAATPAAASGGLPFPTTLEQLEAAAAREMLELCEGNKSDAARRLGITRARLYRLLSRTE